MMIPLKTRLHRLLPATLIALIIAPAAHAAPIIYTFSGISSGRIGNTFLFPDPVPENPDYYEFTNAPVIFTLVGDTDDVFNDGFGITQTGTGLPMSFVVGGVQGTVLGGANVFVDNTTSTPKIGFGAVVENNLVVLAGNALFGTYDLKSDFGPAPGVSQQTWTGNFILGEANWWQEGVQTTGGTLGFLSSFTSTTFSAVVVPEPGALPLFTSAMVLPALGILIRRRRK